MPTDPATTLGAVAELGLILIGGALAFLGSLVGAVVLTRLTLRRDRRLRIYNDLLPVLRDAALGESIDYVKAVIEDLRRAAVVLSGEERRLADQLRNRACDYKAAQGEECHPNGTGGFLQPPEGGRTEKAADEFVTLRDTLDALLAEKLRGAWPR
jgi:hypothetical protein